MSATAIATASSIQHSAVGFVGNPTAAKPHTAGGGDGADLGAFLSLLISQEPEADPAPLGVAQSETENLTAADEPASVLINGLQDAVTSLLAQGGQWQPEIKEMPHKDAPAACEASIGAVALPTSVNQLQLADDDVHFIPAGALPALSFGTIKTPEKLGLDSHQLETADPAALTPASLLVPQGTKTTISPDVDGLNLKMSTVFAWKGLNAQTESLVAPAILPLVDSTPSERPQLRDAFKAIGPGADGLWGGGGSSIGPGVLTYSTSAEATLVTPEAVAEQVTFWVNQELQNAELTLDGAGHEPIEVSISLQGKEAQVAFRSDQAATREILEGAMSHLKEMLASHGLSLSRASVGSSGSGEQTSKGHKHAPDGRKTTVRISSLQTVVATNGGATHGARAVDLFV